MELLLVVVILGVLAAVGLPKIGAITRKEKATRASQLIQGDIERAFAIAGRLRKPVIMQFTPSSRSYQVVDAVGGAVRLTRRLDVVSDFSVQSMTVSPASVTIGPNGVAEDSLNVVLTSLGTVREISMTRVGLIRRVR